MADDAEPRIGVGADLERAGQPEPLDAGTDARIARQRDHEGYRITHVEPFGRSQRRAEDNAARYVRQARHRVCANCRQVLEAFPIETRERYEVHRTTGCEHGLALEEAT